MDPAATKPKAWAVLAYLVADDKGTGETIDTQVREELKAICLAADYGQVSIAAQVDFKNTRGVSRGAIITLPKIRGGFEDVPAEDQPLWRKIVGSLTQSSMTTQFDKDDLNAAGASVLADFLRYGHQACPADRHLIFFHGHASGPMGLFYDRDAKERAANTLRLNDLATSIEATGHQAAVVVFRDCYMNTLETAYQIRHVAEFMIASQAEAPIAGIWPWKGFLAGLTPSANSGDVAQNLAMQLGDFLDDPEHRGVLADVPIALIDLGAVGAIAQPLKALADALEEARPNPQRRAACAAALEGARKGHNLPKAPGDPSLLDVLTMCGNLIALDPDPVAAPAKALDGVVRSQVVRWHHAQDKGFQGTAIYYRPVSPEAVEQSNIYSEADAEGDATYYKQLALNQDTGWDRIALNPLTATA